MKRHLTAGRLLLMALSVLTGTAMEAKVVLPRIFGDGMVLQRNADVRLWGTARPGATVKIKTTWSGKEVRTKAGPEGRWQAVITTADTREEPQAVTLDDGERTVLGNVLLGEVWICSGQSNMEMPMKGFKAQPVEGAARDVMDSRDAQLRLFTVRRNSQLTPQDTVSGRWQEAAPASVRQFSATAYYFGRQLRHTLQVPVGLIVASWGGSSCEAWMRADWLQAFPGTKIPVEKEDIWSENRCATVLYNGMLHPLIGYGIRGAIWYQGEDNVQRYPTYADMLSRMITGWRQAWGQGDFPFYYCQIAPYDYSGVLGWDDNSAFLREQQSRVETMVPNARMAVLMDTGLQYGIHPRKKREAGERLAILALSHTYGVEGLPEFACYENVEFRGDTAVVAFARSKEWVYFEHGQSSDLFEIAGEDRVFHPADTWIERNRVYVRSDEVKHPVAVRYAFRNYAEGDLMHDGLPVSSFRTDNFDR